MIAPRRECPKQSRACGWRLSLNFPAVVEWAGMEQVGGLEELSPRS